MKTFKVILIVLFFITITSVYPQYGNGGGFNNGNNNGYQNNNDQVRTPAVESEKSKKERFDKMVDQIKKDLSLDDLQVIAVSNVLSETVKSENAIMKKEVSDDEKLEEIKALSTTTDRRINEFLNKEQKEKYQKMIDERQEKIKKMTQRRR
jgi:hypothetical protein